MRLFVSTNLMFFMILLMLIQPVQASSYEAYADDTFACMNATQKIEKELQIKEHLLTTISSVETGRWNEKEQQSLAWPWTINAQGKGQFFKTKAEAVREVKRLQAQGVKSIDVGCMQINLSYHGDAFKNIEEAFDPEKNVRYGANFLKSLYENKGNDWIKAAMAYHSSTPTKALKYKKKIVSRYEMIKQAQNNAKTFEKPVITASAQIPNLSKKDRLRFAETKAMVEKARKSARSIKANEWREAKLAEYRKTKIK
ncbi:MAG: transglycosylase SLT domain-containing protein [Alphaproteobacteria bacterium]